MDARGMEEEARIAAKQAEQDARAAADAQKVIDEEGGVSVTEYEDAASQNHGL